MREHTEKISDSELQVMKVIWSKKAPATYAEIRTVLGGEDGWDTSTIRTLIRRLVDKGVLQQEKKDVYYYTATISEAEFTAVRTKDFLHKIYGGNAKNLISTMLGHEFVTQDELDEVREFWEQGRKKNE